MHASAGCLQGTAHQLARRPRGLWKAEARLHGSGGSDTALRPTHPQCHRMPLLQGWRQCGCPWPPPARPGRRPAAARRCCPWCHPAPARGSAEGRWGRRQQTQARMAHTPPLPLEMPGMPEAGGIRSQEGSTQQAWCSRPPVKKAHLQACLPHQLLHVRPSSHVVLCSDNRAQRR